MARQNMRMKRFLEEKERKSECFPDFGSAKHEEIRGIIREERKQGTKELPEPLSKKNIKSPKCCTETS